MKTIQTPISDLFPGMPFVETDIACTVFEDNHDVVPANPFYVPQVEVLEELLVMLSLPAYGAIGLVGETGTGKTEMVTYIAHHLKMPLAVLQITGSMRPEQMEGGLELKVEQGCTVSTFVEQHVVEVYRNGGMILLDEIDKANPELSASLHPLMDMKPWTLSNGTVVNPHPHTRVLTTSNTVGDGLSARYTSSQQLDSALRSRIAFVYLNYPTEEVEIAILTNQFPEIPVHLASDLVRVGNAFRDALLGQDRRNTSQDPIGEPFSTRTLVKWAAFVVGFKTSRTLRQTLHQAYLNGCSFDDHDALHLILDHLLADNADKSLGELNLVRVRPARIS